MGDTIGPSGRVCDLSELTWEELRSHDREQSVAILPVGAMEAHGPHLPMDTDVVIAQAMAREGARRLEAAGETVLLLPPLVYTPAPFAAAFPGTISIRPQTLRALLEDIHESLRGQGIGLLVLANAHLDPTHVGVLREFARDAKGVCFPDVTRRRWAEQLTDEFRSGACHAGRYETSVVLAAAPESVREGVMAGLPPVPHSLSVGIREGKGTFEEVGGPRAYFGDPAAASREEGLETIRVLGRILEEAVREEPGHGSAPNAEVDADVDAGSERRGR